MSRAVSVLFNRSAVRYDYLCDFDVKVGDDVIVDTKRGEATVVVVAVLEDSPKATQHVKRKA